MSRIDDIEDFTVSDPDTSVTVGADPRAGTIDISMHRAFDVQMICLTPDQAERLGEYLVKTARTMRGFLND